VHAARGLRRVWAWIWAWLWAQRGLEGRGGRRWVADKAEREGKEASPGACSTWASAGLGVDLGVALGAEGGWGLWWGLWWGLGGRGGAQGPGVRRGGGVPVCPRLHVRTASKKPRHATKSKLHADSDCFTCTRATRANPNGHSSESKDENWVSNHRLGQFRISASLSRYFKPTQIFARIRPAALQASLRALTAHSTTAGRSGFEQPETGDLASNNLKDKRRTINTRPSLKPVKKKCAIVVT
jgi:hypothetical protein